MKTEPMHNKAASQPPVYLREWRMLNGLSQTELARRMNVSKSEISRLEGSKRKISVSWLERFSEALGIARDQLFAPPTVTVLKREEQMQVGGREVAPLATPAPNASPAAGVGAYGLQARAPYMFVEMPDHSYLLIDASKGQVVAKLVKA